MDAKSDIFEIERQGDTLVVTPAVDLGELAFEQIESGESRVLDLLGDDALRNLVLDFGKTDYFGTTAIGSFVKLWKRVRDRGGHMAFCNTSEHEREILKLTKLEGLWSVCGSREDAMRAVHV
jgi:anti-anti-sigma factor